MEDQDLEAVRRLLSRCSENPDREGLKDTPDRFLKALDFWTSGYDKQPSDVLKEFKDGAEDYDELVFQGSIQLYSLCEHHMAPFFGVAHVGYIPNGRIIGLSKIGRLIEIFARRLQVQERLTSQICRSLESALQPRGVGVVLRCRHLCMESRGIQKPGTVTYTSALGGALFHDQRARSEFMRFVQMADRDLML